MKRKMLDRWAATHADRTVIEAFVEWCMDKRRRPCRDPLCEWGGEPLDDILNAYFQIDPAQLDRERRALLDAQRAANKED